MAQIVDKFKVVLANFLIVSRSDSITSSEKLEAIK